jgi:CHAT domain-containing protein
MNTCFSADVVGGHPDENEPGGFPAAVMAMGVPIFVGAGWQLYTNPGRFFFAEFYRQMRTEQSAAGTAFRLSLQRMRQYRGPHGDWAEPYFDHPYTWGCLQLTGDGGRVL